MKTRSTIVMSSVAGMIVALAGSANAETVWNVNLGEAGAIGSGQVYEITTADDYVGAATENTVNSTWNVITAEGTAMALADSTGSSAAGVTIGVDLPDGVAFISSAQDKLGNSDEIFNTYLAMNATTSPIDVNFNGLSTISGATYDLIIYGGWGWAMGDSLEITQDEGSGLTGMYLFNTLGFVGTHGNGPGPLLEETDPASILPRGNYIRLTGLTPDGSGTLGFGFTAVNAPVNGFQLVKAPTPGTLIYGK